MKKYFLLLLSCLPVIISVAQGNLALGQWRSLLPNTTGKYVTQTPEEVWFASDMSIVIFDKEENSTDFFDKTDGLSDVNVNVLKYNPTYDLIIAVYANSNIDLIRPNTRSVFNLNDIKRNLNLQGDKSVYDIYFHEDAAFLSTGFGIVKLNLDRMEFEFTTFTNQKINSFTSFNNHFYVSGEDGIYSAPIEGTNLLDFSNWKRLDDSDGLPGNYINNVVYNYNDKFYLDINDTLYQYQNNSLDYILSVPDFGVSFLQSGNDKLIINMRWFPDLRQRYFALEDNGNLTQPVYEFFLSGVGTSVVEDENNIWWFGDIERGFKNFNFNTGAENVYTFNSPYDVSNFELEYENDALWISTGTITEGWNYGNNSAGFSSYENGQWTVFNQFNNNQLPDLQEVVDIEIDRGNGTVYIASFIRGLYIYDGENFQNFNNDNSPLTSVQGDDAQNCRVAGVVLDEDGNLWMTNHATDNPLVVRQADTNWKSFPMGSNNNIAKIMIDQSGNKWMTTSTDGLVVFNEGDDIDSSGDDEKRFITSNNSEITVKQVFHIEEDLDGDIWVGTGDGVIIFECGSNPFDPGCIGVRRKVERADGNLAYLLESENVRTIAVDGANRKWCGTTNGVYLLSEDGLEQLAHFTIDNSPLFGNKINDISINHKTGEVFIGTDAGVISYQGDATKGGRTHNAEVFAFPNPVRSDYEGPIAIRGLPQDADVKITDINGTLVFETRANGGQAIWDGRDYNGREANSGVYLVFSANSGNPDNPDGFVTKILKLK